MKKIKNILFAVLAMAAGLVTAACGPDENFEPGPKVDGAQVYFPNDAQTVFSLGDEDNSVTIPVYRIVKEGALEVSLLADFGDMSDADQALFSGIPSKVSFNDGEEKSEIVLSFDRKKLSDGKDYNISFLIADDENTSPYGLRTLSVTLTPWPWEAMGKGKYYDGFLSGMFNGNIAPVDVNVYRHKSQSGIYMFEELFGWTFLESFFGGSREAIEAQIGTYKPTNIVVDCSDPNQVFIPQQTTGFVDNDPAYGEYSIVTVEGGLGTIKDGVITFPKEGLGLLISNGQGVKVNANGTFALVLPGAEISDYSLSAEYAGMRVESDNTTVKAVFNVNYGADVTGISYVCVDGNKVDELQSIVSGMADGTIKPVYEVEDFVQGAGTVSIETVLARGPYTFVAVPKSKDGSLVADKAFAVDFYFPGMDGGDIPELDASVTLYNVSKLPGVTEEEIKKYPDLTNLGFVISGSEIKSLKYYANTAEVIASLESMGMTLDQVMSQYGQALPKNLLDELNTNGKIQSILMKLKEGTAYQMAILAENIYGKRKLILSDPVSTATIEYNGDLVIGDYTMSCKPDNVENLDEPFVSNFKILPTENSNTKFRVRDFAIADGTEWHAVYDPAKQTLTLDGTQVGYEQDGNNFGTAYGYFDEARTQVYGVWAFNQDEGKGPAVFKVDATTKKLSSLETETMVGVFDKGTGQQLGVAGIYLAGTKVESRSAKTSATPASAPVYGRISPNLTGCTAIEVISKADNGIKVVEMNANVCKPLDRSVNFGAKKADLVLNL